MDSQYLMRGKWTTYCFVHQSFFSICLVNRFNLIQTVGGKINWNCNGARVGQDSVCFGTYHFQCGCTIDSPLTLHKTLNPGLKVFNYISEKEILGQKKQHLMALEAVHLLMCLKSISKSVIQASSALHFVILWPSEVQNEKINAHLLRWWTWLVCTRTGSWWIKMYLFIPL